MSTLDAQVAAAEGEFIEIWTRGPRELRWTELPPQVLDRAPDLRLADLTAGEVALSDFWRDRPLLLLFWRHYGCGCGTDRATRLREEYDDYREAGANVVIVGQGEPERATAYAEEHGLRCPILCDPDYKAYTAYGLKEGQPSQLLFDAPFKYWSHSRAIGEEFQRERREQGRPLVDNPWLLPGEFIVDRDGVIQLAYRYQYCEDFPNPLLLRSALQAAAGAVETEGSGADS